MDDHNSRPYKCTDCDSIVQARWYDQGSFSIGCDCTTVPVVPQMGQSETPSNWQVVRPDCCHDVSPKELDTYYGEVRADYECPDCGSLYKWDGAMVRAPINGGD